MDTGLQKYRAFVTAADAGSLARAAQLLGYSVSSVSRMVADLEASCGLRLFARGKAGVSLTPDGARLLERARAIVAECDRFEDEAASISGAVVGTVRVGTIASVATHVLPPVLQALRASHPGITCDLLMGDYEEIESWIGSGRVDMGTLRAGASGAGASGAGASGGVAGAGAGASGAGTSGAGTSGGVAGAGAGAAVGAGLPPEFECTPLLDDEYVAVVPKNHPLASTHSFPISAFAEEPFIALERGGVSEVAGLFERVGVGVVPAYTVWDDYVVMSMVEVGLGLGIMPSIMTRRCAYDVTFLPLDVPAQRTIVAAWRKGRGLSAAASAFLSALVGE